MKKLLYKLDLNIRALLQEPFHYFQGVRRNEFVFDEINVIVYAPDGKETRGTCFIYGHPCREQLEIEEKVQILQEAINGITEQ